MRGVLLVLVLLTTETSFAHFSHVLRGQEVCRTEEGKPDDCYPTVGTLFDSIDETTEIVDVLTLARSVQNSSSKKLSTDDAISVAASGSLSQGQFDYVLNNYDRLSARNLALGPEVNESAEGQIKIPVLATVDFVGKKQKKFTVHFEGSLLFYNKTMLTIDINDPQTIRKAVEETLQIETLSDTPDELGGEDVRRINTGLRKQHFELINARVLTEQEVDAATIKDVSEIVVPLIVGKIVYEGILSRVAKDSHDQTPFILEPKR